MSIAARITIHPSQFPDAVRGELLASLRRRQVNHKFHYDSFKQTQKWLALHQKYSPSRTDDNCVATYDRSFAAVISHIMDRDVHLIGLGCGGGQKDTRLLRLLSESGKHPSYAPSDVSVAMVLVAREAALTQIEDRDCRPFVCDLAATEDLPKHLDAMPNASVARLITFFGMIPNFEPQEILPRLVSLLRPSDHLLFSANLAPGDDYDAGVHQILPLYDNALTRDWLMTFLTDLGVEQEDGNLHFAIETESSGFKRITADFEFVRVIKIQIEGEDFVFQPGEKIRLFFSYRYTPDHIRTLLENYGLKTLEQWVTNSGEEGIFLCHRAK